MSNHLEEAAEIVQNKAGFDPIEVAFLLGNGLSEGLDQLEGEIAIAYADLPGFPRTPALSKEGRLSIGLLDGIRVACLKGRAHFYETGRPDSMALPLELMTMLGAGSLVVTGSCGSADADIFPGTLALVTDHINFGGVNPLVGADGDGGIVSLSKAYDERMNGRIKRAAATAGVSIRDAVMMWFSGPTFETPAEVKMSRVLGANLTSHSIVGEMILARRLGLRSCAVGAVTHFGAGFHKSEPSYIETRTVARQSAIALRRLLRAFLRTKEGPFAAEAAKPSLLRKPLAG